MNTIFLFVIYLKFFLQEKYKLMITFYAVVILIPLNSLLEIFLSLEVF